MLNEVLTRIHVAHDQALTAACIGARSILDEEDSRKLGVAIDLLDAILTNAKQKEVNRG